MGTTPLTIYYYGAIPAYAIIANLIIIPLTGLIVLLSLFLLCTALISQFFSTGIGIMIDFNAMLLHLSAEIFNDLPYSSILTVKPSFYQMFLFYGLLFTLINIKNFNRFKSILLSLIFSFLLILTILVRNTTGLRVTFLDVGQGDAAFLEFPNGKTMLIDAGNASYRWNYAEKTILPFLQSAGCLHINYLVGSHAHNDHIGGFPFIIKHVAVDTVVLSSYQYHSRLYKQMQELIQKKKIPLKTVYRGDQLRPDPICRLYILHPDSFSSHASNYSGMECNNSSLVMKIVYGENSILFTGDLERDGELPLLSYESFLESEILKVGHHGSVTSTSELLLKEVDPIGAVISVASKNKFNHPSPITLKRLGNWGTVRYLTSGEGTVQFLIEPERITKVSWRE
jgi:competence protein ComEC